MAQESQKRDTDETGFQPPNFPIQCVNNCGFFGSAATNNLCSKCYKDFVLKQSKASTVISVVEKMLPPLQAEPIEETVNEIENQEVVSHYESTSTDNPAKPPTNRCSFCRKRVGLTGFKCRCEQLFCSFHRYSDKHNCPFDYKRAGQDAIAKANPVLKADKIEKI